MKGIVIQIIQTFNKVNNWLSQEGCLGIKRGGFIIGNGFLISGAVAYFCKNLMITKIIGRLWVMVLFALIFISRFDTSDKCIKRLTKGVSSTPREVMSMLSHFSYAYGLVWFSLENSFFVDIYILITAEFLENEANVELFVAAWICCMFVYTFFYFAYHIYFAKSNKKIELVRERIQLYVSIGATISFLMLLFGENREFKIFVVGTMLEYTWLQYCITKELNMKNDLEISERESSGGNDCSEKQKKN